MAHYVTPFLVLNLGSEMVFVIAQRLHAQNIPQDKSDLGTQRFIFGVRTTLTPPYVVPSLM